MRSFLSPAERRLVASLPPNEREVVCAVMDEFDAHLVEDESAAPPAEEQRTLFSAEAA